jgi:hypothetical protein
MRGRPGCMCMRARLSRVDSDQRCAIALPPRVPLSVSDKPGGNSIPQLTHPVISTSLVTLCHHVRATALS